MKMYILVKENIDLGLAMVGACHAAVACNNKFKDSSEIQDWLQYSFRKAVCKVNDVEFEKAKAVEDCVLITESCLGNAEIALAFKPRQDWPKMFKFLRLYK